MPTATSEDTEITLGTGKLLAIFFALVALCAVFFAMGFSLGKNAVLKPAPEMATATPPSPMAHQEPMKVSANPTPTANLKPVDERQPDTQSPQPDAVNTSASPAEVKPAASDSPAQPSLNGYFVQVAAVSKPEDAEALVDALKKKQYPAFSANAAADKLFHVQLGPYPDVKEAEVMRTKLISDGYNPIVKK